MVRRARVKKICGQVRVITRAVSSRSEHVERFLGAKNITILGAYIHYFPAEISSQSQEHSREPAQFLPPHMNIYRCTCHTHRHPETGMFCVRISTQASATSDGALQRLQFHPSFLFSLRRHRRSCRRRKPRDAEWSLPRHSGCHSRTGCRGRRCREKFWKCSQRGCYG